MKNKSNHRLLTIFGALCLLLFSVLIYTSYYSKDPDINDLGKSVGTIPKQDKVDIINQIPVQHSAVAPDENYAQEINIPPAQVTTEASELNKISPKNKTSAFDFEEVQEKIRGKGLEHLIPEDDSLRKRKTKDINMPAKELKPEEFKAKPKQYKVPQR